MGGTFDDKVIAITGAGSGIGRALALNLSGRGAKLALADKDADGLAETKRLLGNKPSSTTTLDVTDTAALSDYFITPVAPDLFDEPLWAKHAIEGHGSLQPVNEV